MDTPKRLPPTAPTPTPVPQTDGPLAAPAVAPSALIRRAMGAPASMSAAQVLQLQKTIGNRAVMQLLAARPPSAPPSRVPPTPPIPVRPRIPAQATGAAGVGVLQRVIMGFEAVTTVAHIQDQWVTDYIADVLDPHTHLYDEDIIAYLDGVRPDWHAHDRVRLENTGGNHWDVIITTPGTVRVPARRITVRTAADGNCAIHAIHAILTQDTFAANVMGHVAPAQMITHVRRTIQARIRGDRAEIKRRLLMQLQRADSVYGAGFGPALRDRLGALELAAVRAVIAPAPSPSASLPEDRMPAERIQVAHNPMARFRRLLANHVPAKIVEAMMVAEKIAPDQIRQLFPSHAPAPVKPDGGELPPSASAVSVASPAPPPPSGAREEASVKPPPPPPAVARDGVASAASASAPSPSGVQSEAPMKPPPPAVASERVASAASASAPSPSPSGVASEAPMKPPPPPAVARERVASAASASPSAPVSSGARREAPVKPLPPAAVASDRGASASSASSPASGARGDLPPPPPRASALPAAREGASAREGSASAALPAKAKVPAGPDRDEVRAKVLALEGELMELVEFEAQETQFLTDMRTATLMHHAPKREALRAADARLAAVRAASGDVAAAEAEVGRCTEAWQAVEKQMAAELARFTARSEAAVAKHRKHLPALISDKRKVWMALMEELCGTHVPGGNKSYAGLVKRHDAKPGGYGRVPTPDDARLSHRQVEVLHGHGGWNRTGLVSEGLTNPAMGGLTSLSEILDRANAIRATKKLMAIPADRLDLAFVDHHGSTIMMGNVMRGAYPDLMALPLAMHKRVVTLLEEAATAKADPDAYIRGKCSKMASAQSLKPKAKASASASSSSGRQARAKSGKPKGAHASAKVLIWTDLPLWNAYQQVKAGMASGKPAEYVDILSAATHGAVRFPDSRLGPLMGLDQGEKAMRAGAVPGYRVTTVLDLAPDSREGSTLTARLSDAIVERLSEIEVDKRPIRIIWAGCRSEQWRKGFSDDEFLGWIERAAASRRAALGGKKG